MDAVADTSALEVGGLAEQRALLAAAREALTPLGPVATYVMMQWAAGVPDEVVARAAGLRVGDVAVVRERALAAARRAVGGAGWEEVVRSGESRVSAGAAFQMGLPLLMA
ncbi:MAG: hypothetical protein AVDCRST_MAG77-2230 [uncultured Chloroflexi bacterium]|uniref:Uncharacterized protein n=1 Tax=uncultured Chloroflexota bacterium TaxID=166587 RepID=A0A6J4ILT6_9CHLR|nr:MAG: hypothetical protein AVDCRST_MAG77-2230 [uncultured Chloroflexota bacterium]